MESDNSPYRETYKGIEEKAKRLEALINLSKELREKERRIPIPFNDFLYLSANNPSLIFRDIFQLFYDMLNYYVPEGKDEYKITSDSIGFVGYDFSNLFIKNCDSPFFADRLLANRFMNLVKSLKQGTQQNHIYLFEGPPGSGKSTFLNNLLQKLEEYSVIPEGILYETYWSIDIEKLTNYQRLEQEIRRIADETENLDLEELITTRLLARYPNKYIEFSCPNHDHPILQIPKSYREKFLDELIQDENFKEKLFNKKEYEWVLKENPCNICKSLHTTLLDDLDDPIKAYNMLFARKALFDRQSGEGISVFNPGDALYTKPITNPILQNSINEIFKTEKVVYVYSNLARTNNGILAIMDIKEHNIDRLNNLHGIISDGVHKVELVEERIKSLFMGLVNPEDKVHFENVKSFQDRIITINIPYVLDYNTEVEIYKNKFGKKIKTRFLPRVLENFAKIIISTRLEKESAVIKKWLGGVSKYDKYMDSNQLLLKMDLFTGLVPNWISQEDIKRFDFQTRKDLIAASEDEGKSGFSGRQSIQVFNEFYANHQDSKKLITMNDIIVFFTSKNGLYGIEIPEDFVKSVENLYDYNVLQEVKEAIYYYNEKQISRDIQNYLFSINFEIGDVKKCEYTKDEIEISEEYFENFEVIFLGSSSTSEQRKTFRKDAHRDYIVKTLAQEINVKKKNITDTSQHKDLFKRYISKLKENALAPFIENENFRRAIQDFGAESFNTYDSRLKRDVNLLINNLKKKFKYNQEGAKQISIYVLDKDLVKKY